MELILYKDGWEVCFVFNEDIVVVLKKVIENNIDSEVKLIVKIVNIICWDFFNIEKSKFYGIFEVNC